MRYWNAVVEYAVQTGQERAVQICQPARGRQRSDWRAIDRATKDLREILGIGGHVWEPLPELKEQ